MLRQYLSTFFNLEDIIFSIFNKKILNLKNEDTLNFKEQGY
jgi:hypothetical protein